MDVYEEACDRYLDDLYRIACITLNDGEQAVQIVEAVCKAGVQRCRTAGDARKIRLWLVTELYRRCRAQLPAAAGDSLPASLRSLSSAERLQLAIRTASGLTAAEVVSVFGDPPANPD